MCIFCMKVALQTKAGNVAFTDRILIRFFCMFVQGRQRRKFPVHHPRTFIEQMQCEGSFERELLNMAFYKFSLLVIYAAGMHFSSSIAYFDAER